MDPALAYDTVSYEPILNAYQTLVSYQGSQTAFFTPTIATCVPGTPQCTADYGSSMPGFTGETGGANGIPEFYTFVIDPAAHFYDPRTGVSWNVYPSDVMFSLARTLSWVDIPYESKTAAWIVGQSLLQYNGSGIHAPLNNQPAEIFASMYINDSTYCPATAMDGIHGDGCITFNADGSGQLWVNFLQFVADNLGSSIVPCGPFTGLSAGVPGWTGSGQLAGDGPCLLPDNATSTNLSGGAVDPAWQAYVHTLATGAYWQGSWDNFQELDSAWPATQPFVQWKLIGSGPYAVEDVNWSAGVGGYQAVSSPGYQEPSGCNPALSATFPGQYTNCYMPAQESPAPTYSGGNIVLGGYNAYMNWVNVYWEPSDAAGISAWNAHDADSAAIEIAHTSTIESEAAAGNLQYFEFPTISSFFTMINLQYSESSFTFNFPGQPAQTLPETALGDYAFRNFYVDTYPYSTVESSIRTVGGIAFSYEAGGPIPYGMTSPAGSYYPSNISYQIGSPGAPSGPLDAQQYNVSGPAWWWNQLYNVSASPYYDPSLVAACTVVSPCTWSIAGQVGDPSDDAAIADWIGEIQTISNGVLKPTGGASFDLTFPQFLVVVEATPGNGPVISTAGTGWVADYPYPSDYLEPMVLPNGDYTGPDAVSEVLESPQYTQATCPFASTYAATPYAALLAYYHMSTANASTGVWAGGTVTPLTSACQGIAYEVAVQADVIADAWAQNASQILWYTMADGIYNALSLYVYNGQETGVPLVAPWISPSSWNENPLIGGGGDQAWYNIRYETPVVKETVSFHAVGLPAAWPVNDGFKVTGYYNSGLTGLPSGSVSSLVHTVTTVSLKGNLSTPFYFSAGTNITGYGLAKVTGPAGTTFSSIPALTGAVTVTLTFGKLETVTFNPDVVVGWPGLPSGYSWEEKLVPATLVNGGYPPLANAGLGTANTGTAIVFSNMVAGSHYTYSDPTKPVNYQPSGAKGTLVVPAAAHTVQVKFKPYTTTVTFVETGLTAATPWEAYFNGTLEAGSLPFAGWSAVQPNFEIAGAAASIHGYLTNGSYTWNIPKITGKTPTPATNTLAITHTPAAVTIHVAFAAEHAMVGTAVALGHPNLIAAPVSRD